MVKSITYQVLKKMDQVEIRRYGPIYLATVRGSSDNGSFQKLFDYIQGSNRSDRDIPMTAPVISSTSRKIPMTSPVLSDERSFSFVLPQEMDSESIPIPLDQDIQIERIPSRTIAVITFSGRAGQDAVKMRYQQLMDILRDNDIRTVGSPFLMRYNSPFMPGPFRRNEAAVKIIFNP